MITIHNSQNWLKPSFTYFKDLQLMEETELSEDIIAEFQKISVGEGSANAADAGCSSSQPPGCV